MNVSLDSRQKEKALPSYGRTREIGCGADDSQWSKETSWKETTMVVVVVMMMMLFLSLYIPLSKYVCTEKETP